MERRAEHLLAEMGFNRSIRSSMVFEGELATDDPTAGQRIVNGWKNVVSAGSDEDLQVRQIGRSSSVKRNPDAGLQLVHRHSGAEVATQTRG
jgi:hypothetical protein